MTQTTDSQNKRNKTLNVYNYGNLLTQELKAEVNHGFLAEIDLRTRKGRLALCVYAMYCEDKGGESNMSIAQMELARRAATIGMTCADLEERLIMGENVDDNDFAKYMLATRALTTVLRQLGIKREMKDITPNTLDQYLGQDER